MQTENSNQDTTSAGTVVLRGPMAAQQFQVPTDNQKLVGWLNEKKNQGRPIMPYNQMKLNMAFVLGYQWVTWDHRMRAYRRPTIDIQDPNTPVRISSNKIGGIVERTIAKLTKSVPEPECRPVSDDDADVDGARVGTRLLNHELDRLHWSTELQRFLFWPCTLGYGFLHPWWDAKAGDMLLADDGDEEGSVFEGEIKLDILAPFELNVDPSALTMREARWAVRTTTMTREAAWEKYDVALTGGGARSLTHEVQALGSTGQVDPAHPAEEWVNVYQFWMKPCKAAPQGCVITWAGNEVLEKKMQFPFDHGELPFVQCDLIPGFSREGRTWVTDLIPLQTDYNDTLSREATIRRQLTPKFIGAVGQIDPQRITSRVEVLTYVPGIAASPPTLEMPNGAWAAQFEMGMNRDSQDMGERSGMNEASSGKAASTAPAASIMALQETDDTKNFLTATCLATAIADTGKQILQLARQFWTEERTVRVWSDDNSLAAYRYMGSDIDQNLDVHVSAESALPQSKAARAQLFLELQKIFPQAFDVQTLMNLLEVPGVDSVTAPIDLQTRLQRREISDMLAGGDPEVKPFHNHTAHLKVLNDFRCSLDYLLLDNEDQARFDAHAAIHEMLVLRQQGTQIATPNPIMDQKSMDQANEVFTGPAGTGSEPDPSVNAGSPPASAMNDSGIAAAAGIGGTGEPGQVPDVDMDQQAAAQGM